MLLLQVVIYMLLACFDLHSLDPVSEVTDCSEKAQRLMHYLSSLREAAKSL